MLTSLCSRLFFVCEIGRVCRARFARPPRNRPPFALKRRRVARLDRRGPEIRHVGIEDERAQPILGLLDRRLRDDDRLLVDGDFRLRLDDVDRRHGADLDAPLVVPERPLRQLERLPLRHQVVDVKRGPKYAFFTLRIVCTMVDHAQLDVGEIARLLAEGAIC